MRHIHRLLTALALASIAAPVASAQVLDVPARQKELGPPMWFAGVNLAVAQPLGEFDDYIDVGGGLSAYFMRAFDPQGIAALRFDAGFLVYGNEKVRVHPFPRISADVTTSNNIVYAGVGPQFMLPNGKFRPYIAGSVGLSYFFTQSSIEGVDDTSEDLFNTTNYDDLTFAYTGAAGVYIPVKRGPRPISIDFGARYHGNGRARYLREGSIQDNPDNSITFTPIESNTNLITWHLGAAFGF